MRILCVDDDPVARAIYARGLGESLLRDEICQASSGDEAVHLLAHSRYDVVITDLQMPGLSGLDVLRAARGIDPPAEVIMVTGKASIKSAVEAMRCGARDYIEKPLDIPLLREKLENIREYCLRVRDAEDMREAKEMYEEQASREVRLLELRVCELETRVQAALTVLRDDDHAHAEDRLRRAATILDSAA